jgi:hypothetical protein
VAAVVYCFAGIELTISANRLTGVHPVDSVGQYMALTIGLGTTLTVLYQMLRERAVSNVLCHHRWRQQRTDRLQAKVTLAEEPHASQETSMPALERVAGEYPPDSAAHDDDDVYRGTVSSSAKGSRFGSRDLRRRPTREVVTDSGSVPRSLAGRAVH